MSFLSVATLSLLLYLAAPAFCGHCWDLINSQGRCENNYLTDISKEECCQNSGATKAWSPQTNVSSGQMFYWLALSGGVPECQRCHENCDNVVCPAGHQCRMRRGVPRCVCSPDCHSVRHHHRGWVCATNGQSFRSHCSLLRYNCRHDTIYTVNYNSRCQRSCQTVTCEDGLHCVEDQNGIPHCIPCQVNCPANHNNAHKVCGTDGNTYDSFCHLVAANCLQGRKIENAYSGPCRAGLTCNSLQCPPGLTCLTEVDTNIPRCVHCQSLHHCLAITPLRRVCGKDHRTYENYCAMHHHSCQTGVSISTLHSGSCDEDPHGSVEEDGASADRPVDE